MKTLLLGALATGLLFWLEAAAAEAPANADGELTNKTMANAVQYRHCLAALKADDVEFIALGAYRQDGCVVEGAVELDAVISKFGTVTFAGKPVMACSFAQSLSTWVGSVAAPLTLAYTGFKLNSIDSGPGIVCRNRSKNTAEKISEHAKGNAIDIASFILENGHRLSIKTSASGKKTEADLLNTLRVTGCSFFTTVLGPGADASHAEHLHFDHGLHGKTNNYRICE